MIFSNFIHLFAVWRILRKLGMDPPFDPVIPLLSLYPKDLKSAYYSNTATSMFIAAQFTIASTNTSTPEVLGDVEEVHHDTWL